MPMMRDIGTSAKPHIIETSHVVEKRDLRRYCILPNGLSVQDELKAGNRGPHNEFYCTSGPHV